MSSAIPDIDRSVAEVGSARPGGRWLRSVWRAPTLLIGVAVMLIVVAVAAISPIFLTSAAETLTPDVRLPPSPEHWLGTDSFGRDRLSRTLVATQLTLVMSATSTLIAATTGVAVGVLVWLAPPVVRNPALRVLEVAVAYPGLLISLFIAAILGAGAVPAVVAVGIASIPVYARIVANLTATVVNRDYVRIAKTLGVSNLRLMTRHVLPSIAETLPIVVASGFAVAVIEISGLSFIGIGVQPPMADLGALLSDALPSMYTTPIEVLGPTVMIVLLSLSAHLIGDGLAGIADPRTAALVSARTKRRRPAGSTVSQDAPATGRDGSSPGEQFVRIKDLTVTSVADVPLVQGVSLEIRQGEIVGVVGESGSGKSITAMALAQLLPDGMHVEAAELRVGALNILETVDPKTIASEIALIYQDPESTFSSALRMRSQLTEVLTTHQGVGKSDAVERIVKALETLRVRAPERVVNQRPYELSGGMRQRAMIAAALSAQPRLIIADEPTTALDVTVQLEILREIRRINRENGTSLLFISHDIAVVEALCDRVVVMRHGKVVETLDVDRLRTADVASDYTRMLIASTPHLDQQGRTQ